MAQECFLDRLHQESLKDYNLIPHIVYVLRMFSPLKIVAMWPAGMFLVCLETLAELWWNTLLLVNLTISPPN